MSSKIGTTTTLAIGAALIGSLSLSQLAAASPVFQVNDLAAGYLLAGGEGDKAAKLDTDGDGKVSAAEAKAGGISDEKFKKKDLNGDGMLDAAELKAAHADKKKGAEGSCGGDKKEKGAEGSCGGHS